MEYKEKRMEKLKISYFSYGLFKESELGLI